jgi:putative transposase
MLFFIELATRRVHLAGMTANPDGGWVAQQARDLLLVLEEQGRRVRFVLRDRNGKFCRAFDDVFRSEGAAVLRTPVQAPNANAVAERFVGTVRAECLDWLLVVGRGHLDRGPTTLCEALPPASSASDARAGGPRSTRRSWRRPPSSPRLSAPT